MGVRVCGNPFLPIFPYNFNLLNDPPFSKCRDSVAKQSFVEQLYICHKAFPR